MALKKFLSLQTLLIILCLIGFLFIIEGISLYTLYYKPVSQKINVNFSGFRVSQIEPPYIFETFIYFGVNLEPPTLFFNFCYTPLRNGTHLTYLFFPFHIGDLIKEPILNGGEIQLNKHSGDFGSVIVVNATIQSKKPTHAVQIIANYEIEKTFVADNRGDLRLVLPFEDISTIYQDAKISSIIPFSLNDISFDEIEVYIGLPFDYTKIQTTPSLTTAPRLNPFIEQDVQTLQWTFTNKAESIVIFCENPTEKGKFQTYLHWSGLLTGIGLPLLITSVLELAKLRRDNRQRARWEIS